MTKPASPRPDAPPLLVAVPEPARPLGVRRAFGHNADGTQVREEEAAAIREAAGRVLGGETLSAIVGDWNDRGITTAGGGPWRVNSLSNLLVQGRLVAGPQILDEDTHQRLVALHASRSKGPRRPTRRYLLTGLLRCWRCEGTLRGMPRTGGADLYVCPGPPHGGCSGTAVTADHADQAVTDLVLDRLGSAAVGTTPVDGREAFRELAAHRQRLTELGDLWASGQMGKDEWLSLRRNLDTRARAAEAAVARLSRVATLHGLAGTGDDLRSRWPAMGVPERRSIVRAALDHVVVLAAEPPRHVFRPERLRPVWLE